MKRNKLRNAISVALVLGATGFTGAAFAQDSAEAKEIDTITVTGTRIKSQTVTASSPVSEIGKEEFKVAGATRVDDLVNQYPQMSPYFDSFANNGAQGYPTADLRGLGTNRTLTLINGRRIQPGNGIAPDLSIVPAALIQRVDLLTGGASAVYGADAVAGVVNFVLDSEFEGISLNAGYSAYQHNNDNEYLQGKMDARGFTYPTGNSGLDGQSQNIDMVFGSQFADGNGHATAWLTWRKNDALYQGQRDYSSCSFEANKAANGTYRKRCGGSGTAPNPNFYIDVYDELTGAYLEDESLFVNLTPGDIWVEGDGSNVYNYAPINFYQRPETKINFGATVKYEISEHARPYVELMYSNRDSEIQVAESGTFFGQKLVIEGGCANPLLGTACDDLGINPDRDLEVYVGKRNVEGGPRNFSFNDSAYRVVTGMEGAINDNWSYDISMLYGKNNTSEVGVGDFLSSRITDALLACADPDLADTSACYNVWQYGGVTADAANNLAGTRMSAIETSITSVNGYVSGDTGFGFVDGSNIGLVAGFEWRKEQYSSMFDSFSQAGDFAGAGGPSLPLSGETEVRELFVEAGVPVFKGDGFVKSFNLDLGYRYSDYELSGAENTWKVGFTSDIASLRFRGGFNKAIRAPNMGELFAQQQIALWSGVDNCAGADPKFNEIQCENTGVDPDTQYGNISVSTASQYNMFIGGNANLSPEQAETWTFGFAFTPVENLDIAIDYYDIKIEDRIGTVGAGNIIDACALTGDTTLCSFIKRNPATGDLWRGEAGYVINPTRNFGELEVRGLDINATYRWDMWGGRMSASFVGTRNLEYTVAPLAGLNDAITYDCAGLLNSACQLPEWRHIASLRYGNELFSVNLRWRYTGSLDYIENDGTAGQDSFLITDNGGKVDAYNFFDISGSINLSDSVDLTIGVNNVADKEPPFVGSTLALNGNALGGYDQAGRYIFANLGVKF